MISNCVSENFLHNTTYNCAMSSDTVASRSHSHTLTQNAMWQPQCHFDRAGCRLLLLYTRNWMLVCYPVSYKFRRSAPTLRKNGKPLVTVAVTFSIDTIKFSMLIKKMLKIGTINCLRLPIYNTITRFRSWLIIPVHISDRQHIWIKDALIFRTHGSIGKFQLLRRWPGPALCNTITTAPATATATDRRKWPIDYYGIRNIVSHGTQSRWSHTLIACRMPCVLCVATEILWILEIVMRSYIATP